MGEISKVAVHASDSTNWYSRDGQAITAVKSADGKRDIKPTLAHARKLQLAPGVTTIIKCADKPQLTLWKQRQAILSALTLPRLDTETEIAWMQRVEEDMGRIAAEAAEEGTRIHRNIQRHYQGESVDEPYALHVFAVVEELGRRCGIQKWVTEKACTAPCGVGTKSDLHSEQFAIDFKGREFTADDADGLQTYDEHALQLAATRMALGMPDLACGIVFVSRKVPGLCRLVLVPEEELVRGLGMFRALLAYWQIKNRYRPEWSVD